MVFLYSLQEFLEISDKTLANRMRDSFISGFDQDFKLEAKTISKRHLVDGKPIKYRKTLTDRIDEMPIEELKGYTGPRDLLLVENGKIGIDNYHSLTLDYEGNLYFSEDRFVVLDEENPTFQAHSRGNKDLNYLGSTHMQLRSNVASFCLDVTERHTTFLIQDYPFYYVTNDYRVILLKIRYDRFDTFNQENFQDEDLTSQFAPAKIINVNVIDVGVTTYQSKIVFLTSDGTIILACNELEARYDAAPDKFGNLLLEGFPTRVINKTMMYSVNTLVSVKKVIKVEWGVIVIRDNGTMFYEFTYQNLARGGYLAMPNFFISDIELLNWHLAMNGIERGMFYALAKDNHGNFHAVKWTNYFQTVESLRLDWPVELKFEPPFKTLSVKSSRS